jgi:hypothetical protein
LVSGSPCSAGVKSCAAGAGEANLKKAEVASEVVAGRAANERTNDKPAADDDDDEVEGSPTAAAAAAPPPRLEAAARARRSICWGLVL